MASKRQVTVGGVQIGGGAPVAVQTMTKTETANLGATMDQIRTVAEAGADLVRVAVPREKDVEALKTIVVESPIPVITDFKVSIKSTSVPNTIAANRLLSEKIDYPLHLGITEAGTKWSGSLKSAVGLGTLLAD